ncbi:hypothetical protein A2707_01450 [Candidatus Saccharibacteria bacterium RIFCSPHIGHO2_01_FULL_45_15]|nr:MAG: hypothetical protein A2707_01450 [Candidatus Saccharibacteria bacterium RIFCSPHIGHO2_01_FULL_45_15]OGL32864.1 MAG: hypothetical protein A3E76_05870 [Candidatus Saccharibacteria bacterium RIFCSPHIGHO2_12_FULL_44_22]
MNIAKPSRKLHYIFIILTVLTIVGIVLGLLFFTPKAATPSATTAVSTIKTTGQTKQEPEKPVVPSFDKKRLSTTDPSSLWVVVNKSHKITPAEYTPGDLSYTTNGVLVSGQILPDLNALIAAAGAKGVTLPIISGYRSYANQTTLYNNYVAQYGQAVTDTISARPGHSEHQLGLAVDLGTPSNPGCSLKACFATTAEGVWLATHAQEYGFIVRYTAENTDITGYDPEGWHIRYIGRELAAEMKSQNITSLETFFDISGGKVYAN